MEDLHWIQSTRPKTLLSLLLNSTETLDRCWIQENKREMHGLNVCIRSMHAISTIQKVLVLVTFEPNNSLAMLAKRL